MSVNKINGASWSSVSKVDGVSLSDIAYVNSVDSVDRILDTYTGASMAYSFRKLSSSYSGYCIKVQNDSAVDLDIGFSGGYLDTAAIAAHCGSGDGKISVWYDQSGNGINATQSSASSMPTIYSSGSLNQVNSKAAASFDGGDLLWSSSTTQVHNGSWYATSVVKTPSSIGNEQILCQDDSNTGDRIAQYLRTGSSTTSARTVVFNTSLSSFADNTASISTSTQMQISAYATSSGAFEATVNSSGNGSSSYTGTLNTGSYYFSIGASTRVSLPIAYWSGNMQEIIFWDGDQSSSRSSIESEIDTYYSIP